MAIQVSCRCEVCQSKASGKTVLTLLSVRLHTDTRTMHTTTMAILMFTSTAVSTGCTLLHTVHIRSLMQHTMPFTSKLCNSKKIFGIFSQFSLFLINFCIFYMCDTKMCKNYYYYYYYYYYSNEKVIISTYCRQAALRVEQRKPPKPHSTAQWLLM